MNSCLWVRPDNTVQFIGKVSAMLRTLASTRPTNPNAEKAVFAF